MRTAPMMKAAKRMCVWTSTAITTFLPTMGTSRLPTGMRYPLLPREVHDPAERQQHVQDHHDNDQDRDYRGEGPPEGAVARSSIQPRHHEQEHDEDRRHNDGPERYEGVAGEEHEHLLVEEEEPLRPRNVLDRRRIRRVREGSRGDVGEHHEIGRAHV